MPLAVLALLVAPAVVALWLLVSPLLAILVILLCALGFGTFLATGIGSDWLSTRGRTLFDRDHG
jgi:hypothetical protein